MSLQLRLVQRMTQQLVMTPQLQQSIKLLQLPHQEVAALLGQAALENPTLELGDGTVHAGDEYDFAALDFAGSSDLPASGPAASEALSDANDGFNEQALLHGDALMAALRSEPLPLASGDALAAHTAETNTDSADSVGRAESGDGLEQPTDLARLAQDSLEGKEAAPDPTAQLTHSESLHDYLTSQAQFLPLPKPVLWLLLRLIDWVDDDGFLPEEATVELQAQWQAQQGEALAGVFAEHLRQARLALQSLEPYGIGAGSVREALSIQAALRFPEEPLLLRLITEHLEDLAKRRLQAIGKALAITPEEVARLATKLRRLHPYPGRLLSGSTAPAVTPDVFVLRKEGALVVQANYEGFPLLRQSKLLRTLALSDARSTRAYIQENLRAARWLLRAVHMRQQTLCRVTQAIVDFQQRFFEEGIAHLRPLTLKQVAAQLQLHESTISRITSQKYMQTPYGVFELKYFFSGGVVLDDGGGELAAPGIRQQLQDLIAAEDPKKPLSDQKLAAMLSRVHIVIARRTVAKYREMLGIPPSSQRRQL